MTPQEARAEVDRLLKAGEIDQEVAQTMLARYAVTGSIYMQEPEQEIMPEIAAASEAAAEAIDSKKERKAALQDVTSNVTSKSERDLSHIANYPDQYNPAIVEAAQAEIEERARIRGQSFFEALTDPAALSRMGKAALKGPAQTANAIQSALPGLVLGGVGAVTGSETAEDAALNLFEQNMETNQGINELFGTSDALTPMESIMETVSSAAVPGGSLVRAATVATDFSVDQTIRELTDNPDDPYNTIFDRSGVLSPEMEAITISPYIAAPIAIVATGMIAPKMVSVLKGSAAVPTPKLSDVNDFDKFAPTDLQTLETSGDALKAYVVSETTALKDIVERAGVGNIDEIEKTLTLNSHASGAVRAREAMNSGIAEINGKTYKVPVPVRTIYEAAQRLPFEVRKKLEKYLNAKDLLDDVRIAKAKGLPGNHIATEARLLRDIAINAQGIPGLKQFETAFQAATEATRKLLGHDFLEPAQLNYLNANRVHYVPRNLSTVDPEAPFMSRMIQTQKEGMPEIDDWFLMDRGGAGGLDLEAMGNPFEQLAAYTEAALTTVMKNDARKAVVDAVMNSSFGKTTMRLLDPDKDVVEGNVDRLVSVYRNGKKETYITSALQAQLLKFDPYVAKHPTLFAIKRIQEWNMAGLGSVVFAPVTAIRDTIGGLVLRQDGITAGNPLQVAAAVPKQLWARAQQGIATNIYAGLASGKTLIPESVVPRAAQKAYADKISNQYLNSLYHLANQSGGFDGSIMRSNVEFAKNAIGEIKRTLNESAALHHPALDNMVTRFGYRGASAIFDGFAALFDAVQNAPRYAALEQTVKSGKKVQDAVMGARGITGDVAQSGRVFRPDGRVMRGDYADQGVTSYVTPMAGKVVDFARETVPFVNPMIQGTRNLIRSFREDPAGTMGRAWLYVGLPSIAAYSWNEMLGEEYNDYSMSRRSSTDVAMNMYIGIPGRPPEEGVEIPQIHELLLFSSPFTRMLHGITEGENRSQMSAAMQDLGATIMSNSLEVGVPTIGSLYSNLTGNYAPDGIFSLGDTGAIQEDHVGFLPQNIEQMVRTLFAANGDTVLQVAQAMSGESDEPFNDFVTNVYDGFKKRTVIAKNLTGSKTANVSFSLPAEYDRQLEASMGEFMTYFRDSFLSVNSDGLQAMGTTSENEEGRFAPNYTKDEGTKKSREKYPDLPQDNLMNGQPDLPRLMPGPSQMDEPVNPLFPIIGQLLYDTVQTNGIGISGLDDRNNTYKEYVQRLRKYNAGDRAAIAEWQQQVADLENPVDDASQELKDWIEKFDLDLTKYTDRVKLINIIENERSYVIRQKQEAVLAVEQKATEMLREQGMIGPEETFEIRKHMNPMDDNPFGH